MQYIEDQLHNAGIIVPLVSNDIRAAGNNAPGTGVGEVDIYVSVLFVWFWLRALADISGC